ncbi:MAG: hypothetical protein ABUK01_03080 [Leptospirales bacterium]
MSTNYTKIESLKDIDLSKINLGNINDRYIDESGNRFATRFNIRSRKIQIVRIALGQDEAMNSKGRIIKDLVKKRIGNDDEEEEEPLGPLASPTADSVEEPVSEEKINEIQVQHPDIPKWIFTADIPINEEVDIGTLLVTLNEHVKTESERLFGIIGNMKNAGLLDQSDKTSGDPLLELTNIYDKQISPAYEETQAKLEEITKYPKEIHDYETLIEHKHVSKLANLQPHEQWDFVKAYIVGNQYLVGLEATVQFLETCSEKLGQANEEALEGTQIRAFEDAKVSVSFVKDTTERTIGDMIGWQIQTGVY